MAATSGFSVCAFGCTVYAEADNRECFAVLDRYIFPAFPRSDSDGASAAITLRATRAAGAVQLRVSGRLAASAAQPIGLVPDIIHAIDEAVVKQLAGLRAVHAGAVLWNGRALLLPGTTHCGKSSLVAELLRRGATYLSDEYALIDSEGLVHPYPRPLLLREEGGKQVPVLASELNAPIGDGAVPLGWVAFINYKAGERWSVTPMAQSLAVLALLQNTPHALADSPQMVQHFERAVSVAACFIGRRGDATDAAVELLQLIGTS